jgi:hypothetical protein
MVPNSKLRLFPRHRSSWPSGLVAVLESMIAKTIARDAQRQLFRDFACTVLP